MLHQRKTGWNAYIKNCPKIHAWMGLFLAGADGSLEKTFYHLAILPTSSNQKLREFPGISVNWGWLGTEAVLFFFFKWKKKLFSESLKVFFFVFFFFFFSSLYDLVVNMLPRHPLSCLLVPICWVQFSVVLLVFEGQGRAAPQRE